MNWITRALLKFEFLKYNLVESIFLILCIYNYESTWRWAALLCLCLYTNLESFFYRSGLLVAAFIIMFITLIWPDFRLIRFPFWKWWYEICIQNKKRWVYPHLSLLTNCCQDLFYCITFLGLFLFQLNGTIRNSQCLKMNLKCYPWSAKC